MQPPEIEYRDGENPEVPYTILGALRQNPFAIASINQAKTNLYGHSSPPRSATHHYVKFMPSQQEHLVALEDWELRVRIPLFDFPLQREIITQGEKYIDPAVQDSIYTYRYASVPIGTPMPQVPYQTLEALFLDKSDPLLLAESFRLRGYANKIVSDVLGFRGIDVGGLGEEPGSRIPDPPNCGTGCTPILTINPNAGPTAFIWICDCSSGGSGEPETNDCNCPLPSNPRNPAGCVRVDFDSDLVPVQIATIKVKDDWFTTDYTETNEMGCWQVNENYSGKMKVWVQFRNNNVKVKDLDHWGGIFTVDDFAGEYGGGTYNDIPAIVYGDGIGTSSLSPRMKWAAAHTLNTVNQYRNRAAAEGVPLPRTGLMWWNDRGEGDGSAPMLQNNVFTAAFQLISVFRPGLVISSLINALLPDVLNGYSSSETAIQFTGTGFHELGHVSHYSLVGELYWLPYRTHIVSNAGYGEFGDFVPITSFPGIVALGEAIGNFTGNKYGGTNAGGEFAEWDNEDNFIPQGLMFDLGDVSPGDAVTDPNTGITENDNVTDFTPEMIFNALTPNITSIRAFRDRLRTLHLADTPNNEIDYNNLLDIYDVFN